MKDDVILAKVRDVIKKRENIVSLVRSLTPIRHHKINIREVDDLLLDYLVNNSSDALIETVLDMYPDEVRERLR